MLFQILRWGTEAGQILAESMECLELETLSQVPLEYISHKLTSPPSITEQ